MTLAPKCDCGHGLVRHPTRGACTRCACTWYHPNVRAVARKKRAQSEFARIYGSRARVAFVKAMPCVVCQSTPCENAHTENGGMGRKGPASSIVPLCGFHHWESHVIGVESFQALHGVTLSWYAAWVERLWQERAA